MNKILTIIVPSYNMGRVLKQNLNSLIINPSLLKEIEILVVNDGSKDNTFDVAKDFEEKYPNVFYAIDKENGNYGSCVNIGLSLAKGVFVKILDADDCFDTIAFEKFVKALIESEKNHENVDVFFTDYCTINDEGKLGSCFTTNLPINEVIKLNNYYGNTCFSGIAHHKLTYRISKLKEINYKQTEGISYTDTEWFILPFFNLKKVKYLSLPVYKYLVGREGQSMDPKVLEKNIKSFIQLGKELISKFALYKNLYDTPIIDSINNRVFEYVSSIYKYYIMSTKSSEVLDMLLNFDKWLSENCTDYYKLLGNQIYSNKFPIKYIKLFRKGYNSNSFKIMVLFYDILRRVKH